MEILTILRGIEDKLTIFLISGIMPSGGMGSMMGKVEIPDLDTDMMDSVGDIVDGGIADTVDDMKGSLIFDNKIYLERVELVMDNLPLKSLFTF